MNSLDRFHYDECLRKASERCEPSAKRRQNSEILLELLQTLFSFSFKFLRASYPCDVIDVVVVVAVVVVVVILVVVLLSWLSLPLSLSYH